MSNVYSKNLYRVSGQSSSDGTVNVPVEAGFVVVVKHIDVYTGDVGSPVIFFEDHATGGTWWVYQGEAITSSNAMWGGMEVFGEAGFDVRVASGGWDVSVNGYLLALP